jgi:hypothetical protein
LRADRAEQEAWRVAPTRRAQPGEHRLVVTARVLVERGHTPFAATRAVLGQGSAEAEDSWLRKAVERGVKVQRTRAAPMKIPELSPEERAELERVMPEARPRRRARWPQRSR